MASNWSSAGKKYVEKCEHCGANMIVYTRTLRKSMVMFLRRMAFVKKPVNIARMPGVEPGSYADYKRLSLWGLIEPVESEKPGYWQVSKEGIYWLRGESTVPKHVFTFRNEVVACPDLERAIPEVFIWEVGPKELSKEIILQEAYNYQ